MRLATELASLAHDKYQGSYEVFCDPNVAAPIAVLYVVFLRDLDMNLVWGEKGLFMGTGETAEEAEADLLKMMKEVKT